MKRTYKYITLAALALGFVACTQDDNFAPQQEDIVKIASANIATQVQTRVNTLDDGTKWENNDRILLVNNSRYDKNSGTYTYNDNAWSLTDGLVLYASSTSDFTAYYPAVREADFTLPTDQSTEAKIKSADRMTATADGVDKGEAVALSFERENAMVAIIPSFNTEFGKDATISSIQIAGITPYHPADAEDYKAIIAPATTGFTVTLTVGEQTLTANTTTQIEAGKRYTFNLTVGKDKAEISSVSIQPWTEAGTLDDGEAEEVIASIDGTPYTSVSELQAAVKDKLSQEGVTSVTVGGYLSEGMHAAIISAINEVKDEGAVTNGSLLAGSVTYTVHATFADALTAWTDGTTLTLLSDTDEYPDAVTIENKTIALDLNGYKLSFYSTDNMCISIEETGTLTIRDIRGGGEYSAYHSAFFVYGILNIEGGTIHNYVGIQRPGIVNMTGGMLYGNDKNGPYAGAKCSGTFNMSGGTISSKYVVWDMSGSAVNISGDAILTATSRLFSENEGSVITITGGIWSHDPSAYVDTENYIVTPNEDGTWSVTAKE